MNAQEALETAEDTRNKQFEQKFKELSKETHLNIAKAAGWARTSTSLYIESIKEADRAAFVAQFKELGFITSVKFDYERGAHLTISWGREAKEKEAKRLAKRAAKQSRGSWWYRLRVRLKLAQPRLPVAKVNS